MNKMVERVIFKKMDSDQFKSFLIIYIADSLVPQENN